VAGLLVACLVGLLNGLLAEKVKISPIIVTLGTMIAFRGLAQAILWIDNSWLWVKDPLFLYISKNTIGPVPVAVVITLALYVIFGVILVQTRFGRHLYAIGGNQRTAHLCGIPVDRTKITAYVLCGLTAGIGGLILVARLSAISPKVGDRLEFDIITAVVLGGASLTGGSGRLEKTLLGAIMVGMILNYLTIKGIPGNYQAFVNGIQHHLRQLRPVSGFHGGSGGGHPGADPCPELVEGFRATGNMALAILAGIGSCLALGLFYGSLISYVKINSVIVTLAAMIWARGLALGLTNADSVPFQSPFVDFMNRGPCPELVEGCSWASLRSSC
jgi:ribose/xylose/arabinose/galactoside ABC-type transport system permease subunit